MVARSGLMLVLLLLIGTLAMAGCGGDGDGGTTSTAAVTPAESETIPNLNSIDELKTRFNADGGVRLILVLSPNCKTCLDGIRYVQGTILEKIPDAPIHVYAIWTPANLNDKPSDVDTSILTDSRVSHFWDVEGGVGKWFAEAPQYMREKIEGPIAYNFYSLHAPEAQWDEAPAPLASFGGGATNGTIMRFRGEIKGDLNRMLDGKPLRFIAQK